MKICKNIYAKSLLCSHLSGMFLWFICCVPWLLSTLSMFLKLYCDLQKKGWGEAGGCGEKEGK